MPAYQRYLQPGLFKHLSIVLAGLQIVVLDKLDYCASLRNLESTQDKPNFKVRASVPLNSKRESMQCARWFALTKSALQFVKGDIQSADLVRHIFDQEEIDTVMHFAAQVSKQQAAAAL